MIVKSVAQQHNTVPWPGLKPGPLDQKPNTLTIRLLTTKPERYPIHFQDSIIHPLDNKGLEFINLNKDTFKTCYIPGLLGFFFQLFCGAGASKIYIVTSTKKGYILSGFSFYQISKINNICMYGRQLGLM